VNPGEIQAAAEFEGLFKIIGGFSGETGDDVAGQEWIIPEFPEQADGLLHIIRAVRPAHPFQDSLAPGLHGKVEVGLYPLMSQGPEQ
jgi:hypothetical protein